MDPRNDPYAIQEHLRLATRHGTRAAMLLTYHQSLIDVLVPAENSSQSDAPDSLGLRAIEAERLIRKAIDRIGGQRAKALEIILDLTGRGLPLDERRHDAAQILGVAAVTFRRSRAYERLLLLELSVELCRMSITQQC
jgi:hypothetical protein